MYDFGGSHIIILTESIRVKGHPDTFLLHMCTVHDSLTVCTTLYYDMNKISMLMASSYDYITIRINVILYAIFSL